jgi:hypothetical protein
MDRPLLEKYHHQPPTGPLRMKLRVAKCPSDELALANVLVASPRDFDTSVHYVLVNGQFAFTVR